MMFTFPKEGQADASLQLETNPCSKLAGGSPSWLLFLVLLTPVPLSRSSPLGLFCKVRSLPVSFGG